MTVTHGRVELNTTDYQVLARFTSTNESLGLELGVDTGAIVDGLPYNDPMGADSTVIPDILEGDNPDQTFQIVGYSNLHLCEPEVGQWKNATFDPYLTALFTPGPTKNQSKSSKAVVIASTVSVSVVVVLLVVFVILVCTVPVLKAKFIPNSEKFPSSSGKSPIRGSGNSRETGPNKNGPSTATASSAQAVATPVTAEAPAAAPAAPNTANSRPAAWSNAARPEPVIEDAPEAPADAGWSRSTRPSA